MGGIFGGSNEGARIAKQQAEQQQRRTLAQLAQQQGEADQAASGRTGRKSGSRLLTFLSSDTSLSGSGNDKFGQP